MSPSSDAATDLRAQLHSLGQLDADERAAIAAERMDHDDLDLAIVYGEQAFLTMAKIADPMAPTAGLWPRIVAATFGAQAAAPAAAE